MGFLISKKDLAAILLGIAIPLLAWSGLSYSRFVSPIFLPTPSEVAAVFLGALNNSLLSDVGISLVRLLVSFAFSMAIGIGVGILYGRSKIFQSFSGQSIAFFRFAPTAAIIPLLILWFGLSDWTIIISVILGTAPYLILLVGDLVANIETEIIEAGRTLGLREREIMLRIILPKELPNFFDLIRIGFASAWSFLILAELMVSISGLGHFIVFSQRFIHTNQIFAAVLTIVLIGFGVDLLLRFSYRSLFPWSEKAV